MASNLPPGVTEAMVSGAVCTEHCSGYREYEKAMIDLQMRLAFETNASGRVAITADIEALENTWTCSCNDDAGDPREEGDRDA